MREKYGSGGGGRKGEMGNGDEEVGLGRDKKRGIYIYTT